MGSGIVTAFFLTVGVYLLLLQHQHSLVQGAPSDVPPGAGGSLVEAAERIRGHGRPSFLPRISGSRAVKFFRPHMLPIDSQIPGEEFVLDDDDVIEFNKRQSEDYGHMRFGKREDQFDDYGHMRFGRSLDN